tara:strand:- start:185 stop:439 length:255 start_codon:yes stop_codon:yes gene_type:complete
MILREIRRGFYNREKIATYASLHQTVGFICHAPITHSFLSSLLSKKGKRDVGTQTDPVPRASKAVTAAFDTEFVFLCPHPRTQD